MMCDNPNLDRININANTKFDEIYQFVLKILSENETMTDRRMDGWNDGQP